MAVVFTGINRIDDLLWRLEFSSDRTPPVTFRVFVAGVLVQQIESATNTGWFDASIGAGEFPYIEVLDYIGAIPHPAFPGHLTLHWTWSATAFYYRIDELVSGVWTEVGRQNEDGSQVYLFLTRWLDDVTTYQFRIMPVDAANNEGTPLSFSCEMVRAPDPPNVTYVWAVGTGKITVAAA